MFYRYIYILTLPCIFLNSVRADILQRNYDDDDPENKPKNIHMEDRRAIAEKYLSKLSEVKENWIDPFDMMGLGKQQEKPPPDQKHKQVDHVNHDDDVGAKFKNLPKEPDSAAKEQTEVPQFSPPELDNDEKPTFSDIRGDVIDERVHVPDETTLNIDNSGMIFPKSRQICVLDSIYISRWLKKLVLKIEKDSSSIPSAINFPIDSNIFNNLKELSTAKSLEISQLDELICNMIDQSLIVRVEDFDWRILYDYARDLVWPFTVFIIFAVSVFTIYQGIMYRPIMTTFCCIVVSSVFWHWMHLYKQRQAVKLAELATMAIPTQCRKNEFGLFEHIQEYLKSFFTSNECAKYYEALTVDPFWEVSITVAISEAVTSMLLQPLSVSSRFLNLAIKQLFEGLTIFTVIPLLVFLLLILIMLCNYRIRFPFFMGALEPCTPPGGSRVQELKPSKPLKYLKDTAKCKLPSQSLKVCMQKSLAPDTDNCDVSKICRNEKSNQTFSEEPSVNSAVKDLSRGQLSSSPSKNNIAFEQSVSEDDISIIDSDENNTDTENSFVDHILPGCQQNCQCLYPVEYLSNTDCKACGDNLAMLSMDDSFHFSPDGHDQEDNVMK